MPFNVPLTLGHHLAKMMKCIFGVKRQIEPLLNYFAQAPLVKVNLKFLILTNVRAKFIGQWGGLMRCGFFRWDRLSMVDRDGFGVRPFQIVLKTPFLLILIT